MKEGRICGLDYFDIYDMTWGEINDYVETFYEKERRQYQNLSLIAFKTAELTIRFLNGGQIQMEEEFPYWTDEERTALRIERLKRVLRK